MPNLDPYSPSRSLSNRQARQLNRNMGDLQASTRYDLARIEAAAEVEAIRVDGVTYIGRQAMQDLAMLSQLEQQLSALVPLAASRLQAIGDMTALVVSTIVSDAGRKLR